MSAPAGAEVGLYVDLAAIVAPGDIITTTSGRRYLVVSSRVQLRGARHGRQHLRAVVMDAEPMTTAQLAAFAARGHRIHTIRWYKRKNRRRRC